MMDNQSLANRLAVEINDWNNKEENLKKLFRSSPSIETSLLKEKLKWYESVLVRYRKTNSVYENLTLQVVKSEHDNLVNQLYPEKLRRFIYKNIVLKMTMRLKSAIYSKTEAKSNNELKEKLERIGFKDAFKKVERYMNLGETKFIVPVSYYLNEKERLDHSLNFKKDESGQYQFEGFKTSLYSQSKNEDNRQHFFEGEDFNARQSYELLSGRAVLIDGIWKQLDLNDKDASGSYRVKEFPQEYGYDLKKALEELPIDSLDQLQVAEILRSLKNGGRELVKLERNGSSQNFYVEANPQNRGLLIHNEDLKKVLLSDLLNQNSKTSNKQAKSVAIQSSQRQHKTAKSKSL